MQWYYADQGKSVGPVSEVEFQNLVSSGKITPQTLVWHEGMPEWVKHETINQSSPVVTAQISGTPETPAGGQGTTHNRDLMAQARTALQGNWGLAVGTCFVMGCVSFVAAIIPVAGNIISFLISGALALGMAIFFLAIGRGQEARLTMIFEGFQRFVSALGAYFFVTLFTLLWALLLIIPGIIAAYSYSMTFYIMADDPSIGCLDAIKRSKEMMRGMKWKLFCLGLRFLGWALLCALTLCIGLLWLIPYMNCSMAKFYDDVKGRTV
ncbi:MAG: DUF975 family protein [Kiritimatiellae bacterium]|nr:DUF975 family protein [Kiritimatiellia bacterium]MDD5521651.1 DUF975 family protein [Kiritimatiellia bacterium]